MTLYRHNDYQVASTTHAYFIHSASYPFFTPSTCHNLLPIRSISNNMSTAQSQPHPDAPAFSALLDAYARWQHFDQASAQGILDSSNAAADPKQVYLPVPTSAPLAFIMSCPYIDVPDIPEDARSCPICTDPYHHLSDRANDSELKVAQRLACGHYLCDRCVFEWLNPFAGGTTTHVPSTGGSSSPSCRPF